MKFPSRDFCRAAIAAFNDDPDAKAAAQGWLGDVLLVVDDPQKPVAVYLAEPVNGVLAQAVISKNVDQQSSFLARASDETWQALISGGLDPIAAIVQKRLVVRGDLSAVITRLAYRGLALRWLAQIRSFNGG